MKLRDINLYLLTFYLLPNYMRLRSKTRPRLKDILRIKKKIYNLFNNIFVFVKGFFSISLLNSQRARFYVSCFLGLPVLSSFRISNR